jgi:hypothetical protein
MNCFVFMVILSSLRPSLHTRGLRRVPWGLYLCLIGLVTYTPGRRASTIARCIPPVFHLGRILNALLLKGRWCSAVSTFTLEWSSIGGLARDLNPGCPPTERRLYQWFSIPCTKRLSPWVLPRCTELPPRVPHFTINILLLLLVRCIRRCDQLRLQIWFRLCWWCIVWIHSISFLERCYVRQGWIWIWGLRRGYIWKWRWEWKDD